MTEHLGYERNDPKGRGTPNSRNGTSSKTLNTDHGPVEIEVPRDRDASFEPQLVKKRQTRFTGFDEKILGMYARGMTVGDIQAHLETHAPDFPPKSSPLRGLPDLRSDGRTRADIAYTILGSCRLAGVNPVEYLADVLPRLTRRIRLHERYALLPARWTPGKAAPETVPEQAAAAQK